MDDGIDGDDQQEQQRDGEDNEHPRVVLIDFGQSHGLQAERHVGREGQDKCRNDGYHQEDESGNHGQTAECEEENDDTKTYFQDDGADGSQNVGTRFLVGVARHHAGQVLGCHLLALHLQQFLGSLGLGEHKSQNDVDHQSDAVDEREEHHQQAPDGGVGARVGAKARQYASHHLVFGVAVEPSAAHARAETVENAFAGRLLTAGSIIVAGQLLGLADARDDVAHVVDGDGLVALLFQFVQQFGNAGLYIVGNLLAAFLLAEIRAQRVGIVLQHLIGVFINLEEAAAQVNGNILLHRYKMFSCVCFR